MRAARGAGERPGDDGLAESTFVRTTGYRAASPPKSVTASQETEPQGDLEGAGHGRPGNGRGRHARRRARSERMTLAKELPLLVGIALVLALLIKTFFVQAFFIPSDSMENTLKVGDRVLVNKIGQHFGEIERGEVVVFRDPGGWLRDGAADSSGNTFTRSIKNVLIFVGLLPSDSEQDLIKRVIGLPGDRVACCDEQGRVTVNGVPLDETYVYQGNAPSDVTFDVEVAEGRLFVLGDHRSVSADSRVHIAEPGSGTIPEGNVIGRAFVKVWPPGRIGGLRIPDAFDALASATATAPLLVGFVLAFPLRRLLRLRFGRRD